MKATRGQAEVDPSCPYFAHLRLKERGRVRDVSGKATNLDNGLQIVDWRNVPISNFICIQKGMNTKKSLAISCAKGKSSPDGLYMSQMEPTSGIQL